MELIIAKEISTADKVKSHPLFGKAIFIECGLDDDDNFCFDHHDGNRDKELSICERIHQMLLLGRKLPNIIVMNAIRGFDNLVAAYLLFNRSFAGRVETGKFVHAAGLMDRIGPSAASAIDQHILAVINTAQEEIPWQEWKLTNEDLKAAGLKAVESLKRMVCRVGQIVDYQVLATKGNFLVVQSSVPLGTRLYDQGHLAYVVTDGQGKWTYCKKSKYVEEIDYTTACDYLNAEEATASNCKVSELQATWAGSPFIGGSPRNIGTVLRQEKIIEVFLECYNG